MTEAANLLYEKLITKLEDKKEEPQGYFYAPYIPLTAGATINGVKVWDHRWWVNIWCKINWFFHFKERKRWKEISKMKVSPKLYANVEPIKFKVK